MAATALLGIDEPSARAALEGRFAERGWRCVGEGSQAVVELAAQQAPDLVLLELKDLETLRALKADPRTARATVVMVALGGEAAGARCLSEGALIVLSPPHGFEVLDGLMSFIENGRSADGEAGPGGPSERPLPAARV